MNMLTNDTIYGQCLHNRLNIIHMNRDLFCQRKGLKEIAQDFLSLRILPSMPVPEILVDQTGVVDCLLVCTLE